MAALCIDDLNCTGAQACFVNVSWYTGSESSFCACNSFWGWESAGDDNCKLGAGSFFIIVMASFIVLLCGSAVIVAAFDGISFFKYRAPAFDLKLCYTFTSLTLLFLTLWNVFALLNVTSLRLTDTLFVELIIGEYARSDPTEVRFAPYEDIEGLMGYFASIFGVLSYSNISLVWWEAVRNATSFRRFNKKDGLRKAVRAFQAIYAIAIIVPVVLQNFPVGVSIVIVAQLIVFVTYTLALYKFMQVLNSATDSQEKYDKLKTTLRNNAIVVIIFIFIQTIAAIAYVYYQTVGWKAVSPINQVSQYAVAREIAFVAGAISNFTIYLYVHSVIRGRSERLKSAAEENTKFTQDKEYTLATQNF